MKEDIETQPSLIDTIVRKFILVQQKKEEDIFMFALRNNAHPPIKGEITKGKIRWRGIVMVQYNEGLKYTKWLEQRGKQISEKISFEANILDGFNIKQNGK